MPWRASDAPSHTNRADTPEKREAWARIANGILKKSGDEGKAIRIANAYVHHTSGVQAEADDAEMQEAESMAIGHIDAARLSTKDRDNLDDSDFAFPRLKKLPLKDAEHVRNAMSRFNQTTGWTAEEKAAAHRKIVRYAKRYGIEVKEFTKVHAADGDNDADDGNGITKAAAHYTIHGTPAEHCGICRHFEPAQGHCEIVKGTIVSGGWCEHFRKGNPRVEASRFTVLSAMALNVPAVPGHPNRMPFSGVLTKIGVPSDIAPNGSGGKRVMLSREAVDRALPSLLGMGVDLNIALDGHDPTKKVGVITAAHVDGEDLNIEGFIYAADFPREALRIHLEQAKLGFSFEAQNLTIEANGSDPVVITDCVFTGAAILLKDKAAYQTTRLAAEAGKSHESQEIDMDAAELKQMLTTAIGAAIQPVTERLEKIEAGHTGIIERMEANKVTIEKTEPHASALDTAANRMEAAGIGLHPEDGHVHHLRKMAGHMRAEAALGKVPHMYAAHHFYAAGSTPLQPLAAPKIEDSDAFKAMRAEMDGLRGQTKELETKLAAEADLRASAETKIKDLEAKQKDQAPAPERKTLPPMITALLAKGSIEPDATTGKISAAALDKVLAGKSLTERMDTKTKFIAAGLLDATSPA